MAEKDPALRLQKAASILHPFTTQEYGETLMQQAINDAFSVLEWGETVAEEEAEQAAMSGARD